LKKVFTISYFEREGNENLSEVLRVVKRTLKRRPELQQRKIVFFTAIGKGPALAYKLLDAFEPKIIAVTFPPSFTVLVEGKPFHPTIAPKIRKFFDGVGIRVITGRLPFDRIDGAEAHNQQMKLINDALSLFGGGFYQCVQAVLQACDHGEVEIGETVISITGDCAAVMIASTTQKCFSSKQGLVISEILCKPRNMTIARQKPLPPQAQEQALFHEGKPVIEGQVERKQIAEHKT